MCAGKFEDGVLYLQYSHRLPDIRGKIRSFFQRLERRRDHALHPLAMRQFLANGDSFRRVHFDQRLALLPVERKD